MATTARKIATTVLAHIEHLSEEPGGFFLPDIAKLIPMTIRDIVLDVAMSGKPDDRKLFTKSFTIPIVVVPGGFNTADLTTALNDAEPMLLDMPFQRVTHASSQSGELLRQGDMANLGYVDLSEGFDYYAVDGNLIHINSEPALTGNLIVNSFYVPLITALKQQFESELINRILVKLGMIKG